MSRNQNMTLARAAAILASGAFTAAMYRAKDLRAATDALSADSTPPEIGRRKTNDGRIVTLTGLEAKRTIVKRSGDRPVGELRQRYTPSASIIAALPQPVADAWSRYLRTSHPNANPVHARAAESAFLAQLHNEAKRVHGLRMEGARIEDLGPQDQAIYFFASAMAAVHRIVRVRMATPTILGVCNVTDYGTDAEAWSDTIEGFRATLPARSAWASGGPGTATQQDRNLLSGRLQRSEQRWNIDQQTIARHQETIGREGAPTWDLLDRTILDATAVVDTDVARLVAFGSNPGTAPPPATSIPGLLYCKAASAITITNASGEVNFNTLRDWMIAQQTAANYSAGLAGDVLILSPQDYMRLAGQYVNSAGNDDSVIDALLMKCPFLREIRAAREFEPLTAEQANLTAAGLDATTARRLSGGIDVGGVQKRAITFIRDDNEVITIKRGREPYVNDNGLIAGSYQGEVAANTGGTYVYQADGVNLAYQS